MSDFEWSGEAAAQQVVAVAKHMQLQSDIDAKRLVVIGQSLGGFTSVATTTLRPAVLRDQSQPPPTSPKVLAQLPKQRLA